MEVILRQTIDSLGRIGEIVTVKNGYARNYLIPRGLAVLARPGLVRQAGGRRQAEGRKAVRQTAEAQALAQQMGESGLAFWEELLEGTNAGDGNS